MLLRSSVWVLLLGLCIVEQIPCQTSTTKCYFNQMPKPGEYNCHGIVIKLRPKKVEIFCNGALLEQSTKTTFWDTIHLPSDVGNVTDLLLRNCSFPLNVKKILDNLKITTLVNLTVDFTERFGNGILTSDCFQGLVGLKKLDLQHNNFIYFEKNVFGELKDLNCINMQLNNLQLLTDSMFQYTQKLQELNLSENKIENLSENIFQNLTNLVYLYIRENQLQDINNQTFKNLINLKELDLSSNNITTFASNSFDGLKSLKKIILKQNKFTGFPNNIFKKNLNLELADINSNELLTTLPDYLFANLQNLKEVQLEDCNLMILPENLFDGCGNMKYISLKGNAIKSLPENIFADLENLQVLNLGFNELRELSSQLFRALTNLKVLKLNHNSLVNLEETTFNKLFSLEEINLKNNLLERFDTNLYSKTERLKKIILANNEIEVSEYNTANAFNILKSLEELDLSHNRIERLNIDWINFSTRLIKLDLSHNQIVRINFEDVFAGSPNVTIDFTYNKISMVNLAKAESMTKIRSTPQGIKIIDYNVVLRLNNNPINCNCYLYDLIRYFDGSMNSSVKDNLKIQADNLHCKAPNNMINLPVTKLELWMLKCTFRRPCPNVCHCDFRPWDRALLINCENRNLTQVPKLTLPSTNIYNQTHVTLEHNYLTSGPIEGIGYENVTKLMLSFNNISHLTWMPPKLKILSLDNNNISQIDDDMLTMVNSSQLINVSLGGNPYICDCSAVNFYKFLVSPFWNKKIDINDIKCENGGNILVNFTTDDLCPASQVLIYFAYAILAVVILMICVFLILSHCYKIKIIIKEIDKRTPAWFPKLPYDAFICYSHKDEDFVLEKIISVLEGDPNFYKLCIHIRDWTPGKIISDQIITSIDSSRKTLIILSPNFLESIWGLVEFKMAHFKAMQQRNEKVIVVLYGDIDVNADLDDVLKTYVRTNTYVKWGDAYFWNNLLRALEEPNAKNEISLSQKDKNIAITLKDNVNLVDSEEKIKSSTETTPTLITIDSFRSNKVETQPVCLEAC